MIAPMKYDQAKGYADKLVAWLTRFCDRIEIAGSIRRERPVCNDVDIVCIPRVIESKDMLGAVIGRRNFAFEFLQQYVAMPSSQARFISGGETEGKQMMIELRKCQLDLWFSTPENFATRLLCRTGSKEHNIWLAKIALDRGDHWNPYEGLTQAGQLVKPTTEEDIYRALGVDFIPPREREGGLLRRTR